MTHNCYAACGSPVKCGDVAAVCLRAFADKVIGEPVWTD
jgi:hypothetical protein